MRTRPGARPLAAAAALAALLTAHAAQAAGASKINVLFTGDNGGEIAPCG